MRCTGCRIEYEDEAFAEEKLLQAIYGHKDLCPLCLQLKTGVAVMCRKCRGYAENYVLVNNNPYHPACTPYSGEERLTNEVL